MWPGRTVAQKQALTKTITEAFVKIANTTPDSTIIIFSEIAKENWAQSGVLASET